MLTAVINVVRLNAGNIKRCRCFVYCQGCRKRRYFVIVGVGNSYYRNNLVRSRVSRARTRYAVISVARYSYAVGQSSLYRYGMRVFIIGYGQIVHTYARHIVLVGVNGYSNLRRCRLAVFAVRYGYAFPVVRNYKLGRARSGVGYGIIRYGGFRFARCITCRYYHSRGIEAFVRFVTRLCARYGYAGKFVVCRNLHCTRGVSVVVRVSGNKRPTVTVRNARYRAACVRPCDCAAYTARADSYCHAA